MIRARSDADYSAMRIVPEQNQDEMFGPSWSNPLLVTRVASAGPAAAPSNFTADPVNAFPGLLWNLSRINAPAVWPVSTGSAAARVDINGIAPNMTLVAPKISQWCGSAYDSEIISAFTYAADHGIDVVSISFGGYVDRTTPDGEVAYQAYVSAVAYARSKGTVIVAAAGNEHTRIGAGGRVLSHGTLTLPGDPLVDNYGLYETPGGIPGFFHWQHGGGLFRHLPGWHDGVRRLQHHLELCAADSVCGLCAADAVRSL